MKLETISKLEGTFVLAISGGVDSVVLLDLLSKNTKINLILTHVDHGMRDTSGEDAKFVESLAQEKALKLEHSRLALGKDASEATARTGRYTFLKDVRDRHDAKAIITAHHQDDVIETAIINMLRGTKFRGLSALSSTDEIVRPLLEVTKKDILGYAAKHKLEWREDPTNTDTEYLRNYVRHEILANVSSATRQQLLEAIVNSGTIRHAIDSEIKNMSKEYLLIVEGSVSIDRRWFVMLPADVRREVLAQAIQHVASKPLEQKVLLYMDMHARTAPAGTKHQIDKNHELIIHNAKVLVNAKTF